MLNNIHNINDHQKTYLHHIENYDSKIVDRELVGKEIGPFIFSNSLKSWAALNLWNPLFFKECYGDLEFIVNPSLPDKGVPYLYDATTYSVSMKLSNLINLMSENKSSYLAQENMTSFKNLKEDYDFTYLIPQSSREYEIITNLWIGANTRSGLHFDSLDNFLAQIYGIKKVVLISPNDAAYIYPVPSNFSKSQVNPFDPNFKDFPKFKKARIFEGEIKPGDVLFIPRGWYHYVYSPEQSISLNCWYGLPLTSKDSLLAFYRSGWQSWVTHTKDFIWHGILSRPFENKLYSGPPMGKIIYDLIKKRVHQWYYKFTKNPFKND